jgi:hypothetical protein
MTTMDTSRKLTWLTVTLYWGCIVFGLTLPGVVMVVHDAARLHGGLAEAWQDFRLHLFVPGYNFFLIGILNALPFVLLAVFILVHLGTAGRQEPFIIRRRLAGVAGALIVAVGVSAWAQIGVILHPDAQSALVYLFLPIDLLVLIPLGYASARLAGYFLFTQPASPARGV